MGGSSWPHMKVRQVAYYQLGPGETFRSETARIYQVEILGAGEENADARNSAGLSRSC